MGIFDDNDDNDQVYYTFSYDEDKQELAGFPRRKSINQKLTFASEERWPAVLYQFANFLSGIYGYDVTEKIEVDGQSLGDAAIEPAFRTTLADAIEKEKKNFIMGKAEDWEGEE